MTPVAVCRQPLIPSGPAPEQSLQNSSKKVIEELPNGFNFTNSLGKGKVPEATNTIQCCSEMRTGTDGLHTQDLEITRLDQN